MDSTDTGSSIAGAVKGFGLLFVTDVRPIGQWIVVVIRRARRADSRWWTPDHRVDSLLGVEGTALAIAAMWGGKRLVERILGPTADYVGGELREWVQQKHENIKRVFEAADRKLPADGGGGLVSPRVFKGVINEVAFSDEPIVAEYFGGVLASSKSQHGDDRGVVITSMLSRLSTYHLRAHCAIYSAVKRRFDDTSVNVADGSSLSVCRMYCPYESLIPEFGEEDSDLARASAIAIDVLFVLQKEDLISFDFTGGNADHLRKKEGISVEKSGVCVTPSPLGVQLFLWAHGFGNKQASYFFDPSFEAEDILHIGESGIMAVGALRGG